MVRTDMIYCTHPTLSCLAYRDIGSLWKSDNLAQPLSIDGSYVPSKGNFVLKTKKPVETKNTEGEGECIIDSTADRIEDTEVVLGGEGQGRVYKLVESHRHMMLKWKSRLQRWLYTAFYSLPLVLGFDFVEEKQKLEVTPFDNFVYYPVRISTISPLTTQGVLF